MTVVSVGLYVPDHYYYVDRLPKPGESVEVSRHVTAHGGKAANQAVASALLGSRTSFIGTVGDDESGRTGLAALEERGVDTSNATVVEGERTGLSSIFLDPDGTQMIGTFAGAGDQLTVDIVLQALRGEETPRIALLQGEAGGQLSLDLARERIAGTIILDPSPAEWYTGRKLDGVDILTPNEHEARLLAGVADPSSEMIAELTGVPRVIMTRGSDGVEIFDRGTVNRIAGIKVQATDTTGAGDAFNGALASCLDQGGTLGEAVELALRASAWSVTRAYCMPSYPSSSDLAGWTADAAIPTNRVAP